MGTGWFACRVPHPDAPGLADLVAEPGAFTRDDLFRKARWSPAADAGRDPDRFARVEDLWADLLDRHARLPTFRVVKAGATIASSTYTRPAGVGHRTIDDVIQPERVVELYQAGATVVLQGLQLTDPHLGRFANNLALAIDHPVQVNAYLTPPGTQGLELHFDFHDVFVVQLAGRKRWRVWDALPRTEVPVKAGRRPAMPTFDELGEPLWDLELAAGDVLYLPRGFPHAAEALAASSSHLTVGVLAVTWQQAVRHAIDDALADAADLRRSLSASSLDPASDAAPPDLAAVQAGLAPARLREWLAREIWRRQPSTRRRPFDPLRVDADRPVAVTPGPLVWLTDDGGDRVTLGLGGRVLTLPREAAPFLAALLAEPDGFVAADWAGALDHPSRQVVLDRLAAEGVLREVDDR